MHFRNATQEDIHALEAIESLCFSPAEAASLASFIQRIQVFPIHFWILEDKGQILGYINGMVTNHKTIIDDMFMDANLHQEQGKYQSIFGLAVAPQYRKQGHAQRLMELFIQKANEENREGVTLTCKEHLIEYYQRLGFHNLGVSLSVHGGEVWYDMMFKCVPSK